MQAEIESVIDAALNDIDVDSSPLQKKPTPAVNEKVIITIVKSDTTGVIPKVVEASGSATKASDGKGTSSQSR